MRVRYTGTCNKQYVNIIQHNQDFQCTLKLLKILKKNGGWKTEYGYLNCPWINKTMPILIEYLKHD